jgi:hypothetical protein
MHEVGVEKGGLRYLARLCGDEGALVLVTAGRVEAVEAWSMMDALGYALAPLLCPSPGNSAG